MVYFLLYWKKFCISSVLRLNWTDIVGSDVSRWALLNGVKSRCLSCWTKINWLVVRSRLLLWRRLLSVLWLKLWASFLHEAYRLTLSKLHNDEANNTQKHSSDMFCNKFVNFTTVLKRCVDIVLALLRNCAWRCSLLTSRCDVFRMQTTQRGRCSICPRSWSRPRLSWVGEALCSAWTPTTGSLRTNWPRPHETGKVITLRRGRGLSEIYL